jgi:hypothetical protein
MPPDLAATQIVQTIFTSIVVLVLGWPFARSIARRLERRGGDAANPEALRAVEERLARIESSVEAIAVEVERVTEGQRFATRLLSEQATNRATAARLPRSVNE